MSFVVDGSEWRFDGWTGDQIEASLGALVKRLTCARERRERVWVGDELQCSHVLGDLDVWQLWSADSPVQLSRLLLQQLSAELGSLPRYLETDAHEWPPGLQEADLKIDSDPVAPNQDVAWAHHCVRAGRAVACLGLRRRGPIRTISAIGEGTVHWVTSEAEHREFFRAAVDVERDVDATVARFAPHAFPDLWFSAGVWTQLRDFKGGYPAIRLELRHYLAVLDDWGGWALTDPSTELSPTPDASSHEGAARPTNKVIADRFMGLGLDMAPEKGNVYKDKACRERREVTIGGRVLYCEWHGKLEPHQNRVHVHAPVSESAGKVVIAVFHMHLPLPGDR